MLFPGIGLSNTHPKDVLTVDNSVGKIHFPIAIDGLEQLFIEIVPITMGKTNQV